MASRPEPTRTFPFLVLFVLIAAASPGARAVDAVPADGFTGIWYEITSGSGWGGPWNANKYGGGMATYPQQVAPLAIYRPEVDKTFFTVQLDPGDGNIRHALSYYDHQTGLVARPQVWLNKGTGDAHDAAVIAIDDAGYIYQFNMTHGETRRAYIRKSENPYDISSFTGLLSNASADDMAVFGNPASNPGSSGSPRFSYAAAWHVPNADTDDKFLLLHTRYLSGQRDLFTSTSADGDSWNPRRTLAQIELGQYQTSWIKLDGKTVGTIFNVHPSSGSQTGLDGRTDLYYLQTRDQATTWQAADGTTVVDHSTGNQPLTSRPTGHALVYDAADGERVYLKDVNYDAHGNPVIMFLTSPTHTPSVDDRTVRVAHWTGSAWVVSTVTTTDHNYDHGSLYVEEDGTWRVIAPYLDGPQQNGTGGEIGVWTSEDQGANWTLTDQLTHSSVFNHSYVRRPLNADDDFYALWSDGDAWDESAVKLYFSDKAGNVYQLPTEITTDFASPLLVRPIPEPGSLTVLAAPLVALGRGRRRGVSAR